MHRYCMNCIHCVCCAWPPFVPQTGQVARGKLSGLCRPAAATAETEPGRVRGERSENGVLRRERDRVGRDGGRRWRLSRSPSFFFLDYDKT